MNGQSGHAGLFSNLNEMAILCRVMLNNGSHENIRFWSKNVQDAFLTPYRFDPSFGLVWRLNRNKLLPLFVIHASTEAFGHTGWTETCVIIDPKYDLAIVLLTNKRYTPCFNGIFEEEKYEIEKYGKIMTLVYEAMSLHKQS